VLTAVNLVAMGIFLFVVDKGRTITGSYRRHELIGDEWEVSEPIDLRPREGVKL
jgi:hypothetical protein